MTPPPTVEIAVARANESLAAARELTGSAHHAAAISRAYYATLYASMALLASVGMHGKTHAGVQTLVNQHFVATGKLSPGTSLLLGSLEGARIHADYDLAAVFTAEDAAQMIDRAARFVGEVDGLLRPAGK